MINMTGPTPVSAVKSFLILVIFFLLPSCVENAHLSAPEPSPSMDIANNDLNGGSQRIDCRIDATALRGFYAPIPGDFRDVKKDNEFIDQVRKCPNDEMVATLTKLMNSNQNEYEIQVKATYLLVKINHQKSLNKKKLMKLFNTYPNGYAENLEFRPDRVIDLVYDVLFLDGDSQEFLSDAFDLNVDGASPAVLFGGFRDVFQKTPEIFLRELGKKSNSKREEIYMSLCVDTSKRQILEQLDTIDKSSDVHSLAQEMSAVLNSHTACKDY